MYEIRIKGSSPENLEQNIQAFVMSRIDAVESFKDDFDKHKQQAELKTFPTSADLGYSEQKKVDETLTKVTAPPTFMPDAPPWNPSIAVTPDALTHPIHGAHSVPSVAASQVEQTQKPVQTGERDSRGYVWDARIHSSGKSQNKDGSWKNKKGVDKGLLAQVEQELAGSTLVASVPVTHTPPPFAQQVPVAAPPITQTPIISQQLAQPLHSTPALQHATVAPVVQTAPVEYAAPIAIPDGIKPAHTLQTFQDNLMDVIALLINQKKIDQNYIQSLKDYFKVKEIWNVLGSAVQTREMYESFVQYGFITRID